MEQLKERYYDMCRALLQARSEAGTDYSEHPLAKFKFDAKHERERKAEFERCAEPRHSERRGMARPRIAWPSPARPPPRRLQPMRPHAPTCAHMRPHAPTRTARLTHPARPLPMARHLRRLYSRSDQEVRDELRRLEQAKSLEVKMKAQKKTNAKPGGRAAGLVALRASLSANGLGGGGDLAVSGLPSLAGLMDAPRKHRTADVWLRSKDLSNKRPASDKLTNAFEERMLDLRMPIRPLPTEVNINLYNQCRAHVVLLVELEAKIEKFEAERNQILNRNQPSAPAHVGMAPPAAHHPAPPGGGQKRSRDSESHGGGSHKRSHH